MNMFVKFMKTFIRIIIQPSESDKLHFVGFYYGILIHWNSH